MKKGLLLLSIIILIIISCKGNQQKAETIATNEPQEVLSTIDTVQTLELKDSLLIGYPKISDRQFINSLRETFDYLPVYESFLNTMNKKYMPFANDKVIKEQKVDDIVLKLINIRIKKDDLKIELSTYKDNKKIDSIVFYRCQWDKGLEGEQRRETLSYIDNDFTLWNLGTFTAQSEQVIELEKWDKYKINTKTGKIIKIKKMFPFGKEEEYNYDSN